MARKRTKLLTQRGEDWLAAIAVIVILCLVWVFLPALAETVGDFFRELRE